MTNVTSTRTETWVDPFTLELFQNFKKDNWDSALISELIKDKSVEGVLVLNAHSGVYYEALVEDAKEFIEVVTEHFTGYSCDHSAEDIARHYIQNEQESK